MHLQEPSEGHSVVLLSQVRDVPSGAVWLVKIEEKHGLEADIVSLPYFAVRQLVL